MTEPSTYTLQLRVYWEDTDAGGVVFYANYLKFFERARTEWLRTLGIEQQRLKVRIGCVHAASCKPSRLPDSLLGALALKA